MMIESDKKNVAALQHGLEGITGWKEKSREDTCTELEALLVTGVTERLPTVELKIKALEGADHGGKDLQTALDETKVHETFL